MCFVCVSVSLIRYHLVLKVLQTCLIIPLFSYFLFILFLFLFYFILFFFWGGWGGGVKTFKRHDTVTTTTSLTISIDM